MLLDTAEGAALFVPKQDFNAAEIGAEAPGFLPLKTGLPPEEIFLTRTHGDRRGFPVLRTMPCINPKGVLALKRLLHDPGARARLVWPCESPSKRPTASTLFEGRIADWQSGNVRCCGNLGQCNQSADN